MANSAVTSRFQPEIMVFHEHQAPEALTQGVLSTDNKSWIPRVIKGKSCPQDNSFRKFCEGNSCSNEPRVSSQTSRNEFKSLWVSCFHSPIDDSDAEHLYQEFIHYYDIDHAIKSASGSASEKAVAISGTVTKNISLAKKYEQPELALCILAKLSRHHIPCSQFVFNAAIYCFADAVKGKYGSFWFGCIQQLETVMIEVEVLEGSNLSALIHAYGIRASIKHDQALADRLYELVGSLQSEKRVSTETFNIALKSIASALKKNSDSMLTDHVKPLLARATECNCKLDKHTYTSLVSIYGSQLKRAQDQSCLLLLDEISESIITEQIKSDEALLNATITAYGCAVLHECNFKSCLVKLDALTQCFDKFKISLTIKAYNQIMLAYARASRWDASCKSFNCVMSSYTKTPLSKRDKYTFTAMIVAIGNVSLHPISYANDKTLLDTRGRFSSQFPRLRLNFIVSIAEEKLKNLDEVFCRTVWEARCKVNLLERSEASDRAILREMQLNSERTNIQKIMQRYNAVITSHLEYALLTANEKERTVHVQAATRFFESAAEQKLINENDYWVQKRDKSIWIEFELDNLVLNTQDKLDPKLAFLFLWHVIHLHRDELPTEIVFCSKSEQGLAFQQQALQMLHLLPNHLEIQMKETVGDRVSFFVQATDSSI